MSSYFQSMYSNNYIMINKYQLNVTSQNNWLNIIISNYKYNVSKTLKEIYIYL